MKKDMIKKILKLIQIFIVTNTLCVCAALLFYGFLVFMFALFIIPDEVQSCIFTFLLLVATFIFAFINLWILFNIPFDNECSDDS